MAQRAGSLRSRETVENWGRKDGSSGSSVTVRTPAPARQPSGRQVVQCRVVAVSNVTASGTYTHDGVALAVGDVALLTAQTTASARGVYIVKAGSWTRLSTSAEDWRVCEIMAGTYSGSLWMLITAAPVSVGTTAQTWEQVLTHTTVSDSTAPTGDTGIIGTMLNWIVYMLKAITGKSNWRTAPATTLELANAHYSIPASITQLGHVKIDGTTINLNGSGQLITPYNNTEQRLRFFKNGTGVNARHEVNLIEGSNVTLIVVDNPGSDRVDVTIAAASGGNVFGGGSGAANYSVRWVDGDEIGLGPFVYFGACTVANDAELIGGDVNQPAVYIVNQDTGSTTGSGLKAHMANGGSGLWGDSNGGNGVKGSATTGVGGKFTATTGKAAVMGVEVTTTNAISTVAWITSTNTSGTPGVGAGVRYDLRMKSSTTEDTLAGGVSVEWVVATHGSRKARLKLLVSDSTAEREALTLEATGTGSLATFGGGIRRKTTAVTGNHTLTDDEHLIKIDTSAAAITITLPSPTGRDGQEWILVDTKNNAGAVGRNVTLARNGGERINNALANKIFNTNNFRTYVWGDGTNWFTY